MASKGAFNRSSNVESRGADSSLSFVVLMLGIANASCAPSADLFKLSLEELLLVNVAGAHQCPPKLIDLPLEDLLRIDVTQASLHLSFVPDTLKNSWGSGRA